MNKRVLAAFLAAAMMMMTACNTTTVQSDIAPESSESEETTTEEVTKAEVTTETSETTVTETTLSLDITIDDYFNEVTSEYFDFGASLDVNEDIKNSCGAMGVNGFFNIYEFKSTEGLNVGDQITILSTAPGEDSKELKYTIAAINGQFVLVASEWGTVAENDHAPYAIPEVQSVYDAFVAYQ